MGIFPCLKVPTCNDANLPEVNSGQTTTKQYHCKHFPSNPCKGLFKPPTTPPPQIAISIVLALIHQFWLQEADISYSQWYDNCPITFLIAVGKQNLLSTVLIGESVYFSLNGFLHELSKSIKFPKIRSGHSWTSRTRCYGHPQINTTALKYIHTCIKASAQGALHHIHMTWHDLLNLLHVCTVV